MKVIVEICNEVNSGRREGWTKLVTNVREELSDGYAFEGLFLEEGENEIKAGSILVQKNPEGSVKNAWYSGRFGRVQPDGTTSWEEDAYDWKKSFISFRNAVAAALKSSDEINPLEGFKTEVLVEELKRRGFMNISMIVLLVLAISIFPTQAQTVAVIDSGASDVAEKFIEAKYSVVGGTEDLHGHATGIITNMQVPVVSYRAYKRRAHARDLIAALSMVRDHVERHDIRVALITVSAGNWDYPLSSRDFEDRVRALEQLDVPVVISCGNNHGPESALGIGWPATTPGVLAVSAVYGASQPKLTYFTGAKLAHAVVDQICPFAQRHPDLTTLMAVGAPYVGLRLDGTPSSRHGTTGAAASVAKAIYQLSLEFGRRSRDEWASILKRSGYPVYDGDDEADNVTHSEHTYRRLSLEGARWMLRAESSETFGGLLQVSKVYLRIPDAWWHRPYIGILLTIKAQPFNGMRAMIGEELIDFGESRRTRFSVLSARRSRDGVNILIKSRISSLRKLTAYSKIPVAVELNGRYWRSEVALEKLVTRWGSIHHFGY